MLGLGNDIDAHIVSISTSLWFQIIVTQLEEEDNKLAGVFTPQFRILKVKF